MQSKIPSIQYLRGRLAGLTDGQLRRVAMKAGVSHSTVRRIAEQATDNPGIETCRRIDEQIDAVLAMPRPRVIDQAWRHRQKDAGQ